ncbi:MAG: glycosyltransferase [Dehalococcoidia bacterium]|nr:glycosyltransferase [Dehalococcoidia bacterium]
MPLWPNRPAVVATVHDLRHLRQPAEFAKPRRVYRGVMWGQGLRRADALVANSHSTAEHVLGVRPSADGRLHTIHFGCDHVLRWPQADPTDAHAIAFADWTNKRPDLAVAAWGVLRREWSGFACALDIVGAPRADRSALRQPAAEAGVGDLVRVHGYLTEDVHQALFGPARLVVSPSTLEGFGFPVLEGMRLGIPAVCVRGAGLEEAGGRWAFHADGWTPHAFADAGGRALFDPDRRSRSIEGGRKHSARFHVTPHGRAAACGRRGGGERPRCDCTAGQEDADARWLTGLTPMPMIKQRRS